MAKIRVVFRTTPDLSSLPPGVSVVENADGSHTFTTTVLAPPSQSGFLTIYGEQFPTGDSRYLALNQDNIESIQPLEV